MFQVGLSYFIGLLIAHWYKCYTPREMVLIARFVYAWVQKIIDLDKEILRALNCDKCLTHLMCFGCSKEPSH